MRKFIEIKLIDKDLKREDFNYTNMNNYPRLFEFDCPNTINNVKSEEIDINHILDGLTAHFVENKLHTIIVDISERDACLAPVKEMTIGEIEKKLGHKIKIINN